MNFLLETCADINASVQRCQADLVGYLEKELLLDKKEAGKDIDMISSWLQQFKR